jgi:hypothetical protein
MRVSAVRVHITRAALALAYAALFCGAGIAASQQLSSPTELEGVWIGERQEMEGQVRKLAPGEMRLTFQGKKLLAVGLVGSKEVELSFDVETASSPRKLLYTLPTGTTRTLVYKVEKDVLTLASPMPGRPCLDRSLPKWVPGP